MKHYLPIVSNAFFQVLARVASSGVSFLITILLARQLGILGYGDFAKITAYVSLFYLGVDFGLNAIFLQRDDNKVRFQELFYGRVLLSGLVFLLANLLAFFLPYNPSTAIGFSPVVRLGILLFSFTLVTEGIVYTASAIFQRELQYKYLTISSLFGSLVTLLFVIFFSSSLFLVLFGFVLGGIIKAACTLFFAQEDVFPVQFDTVFLKRLFIETLPVTLMLIFNLVYFRVDMLLLGSLKSSSDVAIYDVSYKFFDFFIALPLFLSNALYPTLLSSEKARAHTRLRLLQYAGVFALCAMVISLVMWFAAPLVSFIRPDFSPAVVPLRIFLLSLPVFFVTSIFQWVLIAKKHQRFLAIVYLIATVINIAANVFFIPTYSYVASAIITGLSETFVLVLLSMKLFLSK